VSVKGRRLDPAERTRLARAMRDEDRARDGLDEVLRRRDAVIRDLRWGDGTRGEIMPETIRQATRSKHHPDGLSRTTVHYAAGRARDQRTDDERE